MINDDTGDLHSISKPAALRIASAAWTARMLPTNVMSGFASTGLWPVSLENMMKRYNLFKDGGVPRSYLEAFWIERRQILRAEMLSLPAKAKKKKTQRKRIDVGGRILTLELLNEIDKTKEERAAAAKMKAT
ncbi:hypothetical protein AaE_002774, partial [Aphanomyces astaci]